MRALILALLLLANSPAQAAWSSSNSSAAWLDYGVSTFLVGKTKALWCSWIKVVAWDAAFQGHWGQDVWPAQTAGWGFQRNNATDAMWFYTRGSGTYSTASCGTGYAGQGWIHVCAYVDTVGGNMYCYKNAAWQATAVPRNPF